LFLGAHPDNLEIGCGGTFAKMVGSGWDVWICILTDESAPDIARTRRDEARKSAIACGVSPDHVLFLGASDTHLQCDGQTVGALRVLLSHAGCNPDLLFTHTHADSRGDHRAAHELIRSTFRGKPILCFGVVNSLVSSEFAPKVFVEVSAFAKDLDLQEVEAFEVVLQEGADGLAYLALSMNDCAFHNFWYPVIREQGVTAISSVPVYRQHKTYRWSPSKEREGAGRLVAAFTRMWHDRNPMQEMPADGWGAEEALKTSNCLLVGGAASNGLVQNWFNHFEGLRYLTDYSMPDFTRLRIVDRRRGADFQAEYRHTASHGTTVRSDVGVLTVMRNPMTDHRTIVACSGIHGFGTYACLRLIAEPRLLRQLPAGREFQILVRYDVGADQVTLIEDSWHPLSSAR
jgi:LmbE family N-acetylglucosaminyl deacetylase